MDTDLDYQTVTEWPADGLEFLARCPICGASRREVLYEGLTDRLFGAPGHWTMFKCHDCGSGYLDPRPTRETIELAYRNYITHELDPMLPNEASHFKQCRVAARNGYLNRKFGYKLIPAAAWGYWIMHLLPPPLRLEWDHYARHLKSPRPGYDRLLDIGCGNGAFLARAHQAKWKTFGTDFDPSAVEIAGALGSEVWAGDYKEAPFEEESFDVVTSHQVVEHVHDPREFVSDLYKWLKPGGHLWLGTPNFNCRIHKQFGRSYGNLHPPQHLSVFSERAILALIKEAGFINVKLLRRGFFEYHQTIGSAAISRGQRGSKVFKGVLHPKVADMCRGLWNELLAWLCPTTGSDFVIVANKPKLDDRPQKRC